MAFFYTSKSYCDHFLSIRNFYLLNTASYGNCYVFNHKVNSASDVFAGKRITSQTGPSAGLTLMLDAETEKYMMNKKTMMVLKLIKLILLRV